MNLYILALVAAMSFASAWTVQDWRHDSQELTVTKTIVVKEKAQAKTIDTAAVAHEKDKRQIQTEFVVITERVNDVVQTDFYAAGAPACLNADGVRLYNEAATGPAKPASEPAGAVPGAEPPRWWQSRGSAAKAD